MNMFSDLFSKHAQVLQAMAHPRRLEIINLLRDQSLPVSQIQTMLALRQAYLSQHLAVLREAGVLVNKKKGKEIYYRLAHPNYIEASDLIREILGGKERKDIISMLPFAIDPVCKMRVSIKQAGDQCKYQNHTYYFCASGCAKTFKQNPKVYAGN